MSGGKALRFAFPNDIAFSARDDDPVLTEVLGGGIITAVSEHRPSLPSKILGIGDYNSSIRMVKLPLSFDVPLDDELSVSMRGFPDPKQIANCFSHFFPSIRN